VLKANLPTFFTIMATDEAAPPEPRKKSSQDDHLSGIEKRLQALEMQVALPSDVPPASRPLLRASSSCGFSRLSTPDANAVIGPEVRMELGIARDALSNMSKQLQLFGARLEEIEMSQVLGSGNLDVSLEAVHTGLARLAREVHSEREERRKAVAGLHHVVEHLAEDITKKITGSTLMAVQQTLSADINSVFADKSNQLCADVHARLQLMAAELRGEFHRSPRANDDDSGKQSGSGASVLDCLPEKTNGDLAITKAMLTQMQVFDHMAKVDTSFEQLLERPNLRTVHRIVVAMKRATGFPAGILEDWPDTTDAKRAFLAQVWINITRSLDLRKKEQEFNSSDILQCTHRQRTRRLLQLLAIAAAREQGVRRRRSHTKQNPCTLATPAILLDAKS